MRARHYLDHASTAPLRPEARQAMVETIDAQASETGAGDPSRIHREALVARARLEEAREQVAGLVGARSREIVFTSGATESIAAAVHGAAGRGTHQVLTAVEHSAVRLAAERAGPTTVVAVDGGGRVDPAALAAAITDATSVVHVQWANHEVGTIQPVAEAVAACRAARPDVLVHVDAAQAAGRVAVDFPSCGADLMSLSAHKLGGPAGAGALVIRRGLRIDPLLVGGDQERARRAGLENLIGAVGFGAACAALDDDRVRHEATQARRQSDRLADALDRIDDVTRYGDPEHRAPHIVCVGIADVEPQAVVLGLDQRGVAVHSGSACASESLEPSPVLAAMGLDAQRSLRLSVGWSTTDDDIDAAASATADVIARLRELRRSQ